MRNYIRAFARLNVNLRTTLAAWALVSFSYFGIVAVLQNLYLLRLGYDTEFIGLLNGASQLVWAAFALPAAMIARRIGTRNALVTAYALVPTAYMFFLLVEELPRDWWEAPLIACQAILGVGYALTSTSIFPYLMAMASEDERYHAFAAQRGVTAVFTLLGSLVAGVLPAWLAGVIGTGNAAEPFRYVLWLLVPAEYLAALMMLTVKPAPIAVAPAPGSVDARPALPLFLALGAVTLLAAVGEGSARSFFNVFMDRALGADTAQIGLVVGITALLGVVAAFGAPPLLARLGTGQAMSVGVIGVGAGLVVLAASPEWQLAGIGYAVVSAVATVSAMARNLFGQELVPAHARTTMAAVLSIGFAGGAAFAAAAGGYLIGAIGFSGMFVTAGVVSLLGVPVILRLASRHAPSIAAVPAPAAK